MKKTITNGHYVGILKAETVAYFKANLLHIPVLQHTRFSDTSSSPTIIFHHKSFQDLCNRK